MISKEKAIELGELMIAWGNGETIECKTSGGWEVTPYPCFSQNVKYRIKKPPKKVPLDFSDAEKMIGKVVKRICGNYYDVIITVESGGVALGNKAHLEFNTLWANYTFLDGSEICKYE